MSSSFSFFVWSKSQARGSHKLVLLALADHADRNGEVELSLRDMAMLCGLSKTRVEEIIQALVDLGELRILAAGAGRGKPSRYWITLRPVSVNCPADTKANLAPDKLSDVTELSPKSEAGNPFSAVQTQKPTPEPTQTEAADQPKPQAVGTFPTITQEDVNAVLEAADISAPDDQPFYWSRKEHRDDLSSLLSQYGRSIGEFCADLRAAVSAGKALQRRPRRISELTNLLGKGGT